MDDQTKKKLIMMGLSCLKREGEDLPLLIEGMEKELPNENEVEKIKNGFETGNIEDELVKKFWPLAYEGVSRHGITKYYFYYHNLLLESLKIDQNLTKWCIAYPAKITKKVDSKYILETIDGGEIETDIASYPGIDSFKDNLEIGTYVALHRDKIHMILQGKDHEEAVRFYKEFRSRLKPKD